MRVLVEAALGHEERGDGARRQAHGGGARRDAAAPALGARVVQHVQRRARPPNALCDSAARHSRARAAADSRDTAAISYRGAPTRPTFYKLDRPKRAYYRGFE